MSQFENTNTSDLIEMLAGYTEKLTGLFHANTVTPAGAEYTFYKKAVQCIMEELDKRGYKHEPLLRQDTQK